MWTIVAAAAAVMTIAMGLRSGFGLFVKPISSELAMGRELFTFAVGLQNLLWGALAPLFGALADRHGAAKTGVAGTLLYVVGLAILSQTSGPTEIVLGNVLIGAALAAGGQGTLIGAVAAWFRRSRARSRWVSSWPAARSASSSWCPTRRR